MGMEVQRIYWIDGLKLFTIFLVILGHVVLCYRAEPNLSTALEEPLYLYIYAFHMPLFMTISGYFSSNLLEGKGDIKKRFDTLIVPCITLFFIFMFMRVTTQNMWYLKSLFACYTIVYLWFRAKLPWGGVFLLCFMGFPIICKIPYIAAYKIDFMLPFFVLGMHIRKHDEWITNKNLFLLWFLLFIAAMYIWKKDYIWYVSQSSWFPIKEMVQTRSLIFSSYAFFNAIIRYLTGIVSSLFMMSCFYRLYCLKTIRRRLEKIAVFGRYSLHIYIIQTFLVEINLLKIKLPLENHALYNVYSIAVSVLILILCILIAKVLEKNKYCNRYLFGRF